MRAQPKWVNRYMLPIPPGQEQERIVDRIESLFAKLDEAKENAQTAVDSFETRKAAIFRYAFSGMMTSQWRVANGVDENSWEDSCLGKWLENIEAGRSLRCEERPPVGNEWGIIKVSAVTWGEFNQNESKTCLSESDKKEEYLIRPGDFLFSRANTIQLVGACVIVDQLEKTLMLSDKILRFSFLSGILPKFVLYFLRSRSARQEIELLSSGNQESMRNIGQANIKKIKIFVPTYGEQQEIVRILDDLLAKEQKAKEAAAAVLERIDLIKKSILARAFRGELGTNDPSEESAVELLKQCLAEGEVVP